MLTNKTIISISNVLHMFEIPAVSFLSKAKQRF